MSKQRHYVIDAVSGEIVNVVLWDGRTPHTPEAGFELVDAADADRAARARLEIGATRKPDGSFTPRDPAKPRPGLPGGLGAEDPDNPFLRLPRFTLASLPGARLAGPGALILVTDDTNGPVVAVSDGTNWRRVTDRTVAG
ncbi:MAG: hypothetical protein HXY25_09610 [Alphaproteobacteria bacterium]|nr:hypothetical protein [Alphaproteobacteria bacterium]